MRVEAARRELERTEKSIEQIARNCGFVSADLDEESFRAFSRHYTGALSHSTVEQQFRLVHRDSQTIRALEERQPKNACNHEIEVERECRIDEITDYIPHEWKCER